MDALHRWDESLAGWAIPDELLATAPESPYGFGVGLFDRLAEDLAAAAELGLTIGGVRSRRGP